MNFFNNKLKTKKYLSILKQYHNNFSKEFIIRNTGTFIGDKSFYKMILCYELLRKTKEIKGDVVEFGIWNGNNLFTIKKILDFLRIKKKVIGYDHFRGLQNPSFKDKNFKKKDLGRYIGNKKIVNYIIKFFKLKNIKIIDDDIMNLQKHLKSFSKLSFIYIDCDLYEPTARILKLLNRKLSIGGIIAFDEGNCKKWSGEKKALNEFYSKNRKKYKKIILKKFYEPDVYLQKVN